MKEIFAENFLMP